MIGLITNSTPFELTNITVGSEDISFNLTQTGATRGSAECLGFVGLVTDADFNFSNAYIHYKMDA